MVIDTKKFHFGSKEWDSYLVHYDTLLQSATDIIKKCDSYFITNCDKSLLQNVSGFLLQNATVFLENTTVITKCVGTESLQLPLLLLLLLSLKQQETSDQYVLLILCTIFPEF